MWDGVTHFSRSSSEKVQLIDEHRVNYHAELRSIAIVTQHHHHHHHHRHRHHEPIFVVFSLFLLLSTLASTAQPFIRQQTRARARIRIFSLSLPATTRAMHREPGRMRTQPPTPANATKSLLDSKKLRSNTNYNHQLKRNNKIVHAYNCLNMRRKKRDLCNWFNLVAVIWIIVSQILYGKRFKRLWCMPCMFLCMCAFAFNVKYIRNRQMLNICAIIAGYHW